jgi:hypothetical protein
MRRTGNGSSAFLEVDTFEDNLPAGWVWPDCLSYPVIEARCSINPHSLSEPSTGQLESTLKTGEQRETGGKSDGNWDFEPKAKGMNAFHNRIKGPMSLICPHLDSNLIRPYKSNLIRPYKLLTLKSRKQQIALSY